MDLFIQIIGFIGIIIWLSSILKKRKSDILIYQGVANLFISLQFFLLKVYTAASMNFTTVIRSFVFYNYSKKNKLIPKYWLYIFLLITYVFAIITFDGYLSLIPIIISTMYIVTSWLRDTKWLRLFYVIAAFIWIYYNYSVKAYAILIGNIFEIITGLYSIFKFSKDK